MAVCFSAAVDGADSKALPKPFAEVAHDFLALYCFDCHGNGASEGGADFEQLLNQLSEQPADRAARDVWHKVQQHLQVEIMPPPDHSPRPDALAVRQFVEQIDQAFFHVDCDQQHDPGRVTIRRLNRVEYENTVEDLLGVRYEAAEIFPRDQVGYGFDNIGDVLSVSPPLMEKYLAAAEAISRQVIYTGPRSQLRTTRVLPTAMGGEDAAGLTIEKNYLLINREGYAYANFSPYEPGEYELRVRAFGVQSGDELVRMAVEVAGERVAEWEIKGHRQPEDYKIRLQFGEAEFPLGLQKIHFVYLNDYNNGGDADRDLAIHQIELDGPLHIEGSTFPFPPQHRRIVRVEPDAQHSIVEAARTNLTELARRAFRQPVRNEDIESFVDLVRRSVERKESFEQAMQYGLQAILVSPKFLFRIESSRSPDDPDHVQAIGQFELASRLSYFLWSTMPDQELFDLAQQGTLRQPEVLLAQVDRMLESPQAAALVDNFSGQYLNLRNLADVRPNRQTFPEFNEQLAADMQRETQLFVEHILREDKRLLELLSAKYTFVNERLAKLYGLPGVVGNEFRKVSLADVPRQGVLTQASILTLTSDPARTLPVKRGKWILEKVLGSAPPPPPPNIPSLAETTEANPAATLREQLARHRQDAACTGCHQAMDPLGLAFENYDAIGRWRDADGKQAVDAKGTLPDGRSFQNAIELIDLLQDQETVYAEQVTKAMLTYALGRGLEPYDQCAINSIVEELRHRDFRFQTLIDGIVLSTPFQMQRGDGGKP